MKLIKQLIFSVLVGLSGLAGSGCSAIGFGIGVLSDNNEVKKLDGYSEQLTTLPKNSHIQIFLKQGQRHEGQLLTFMGQSAGHEDIEHIIWKDKATNRQDTTHISEIDRIIPEKQPNGKWWGLIIGGIIDVVAVVFIVKMSRIFKGLSFFNYPH